MHLHTSLALRVCLLASAGSTLAAPGVAGARPDASAVSVSAATAPPPHWIIKSFTRTCNAADTSCAVSFGVDTGAQTVTSVTAGASVTTVVTNCSYTVTVNTTITGGGAAPAPASQASTSGILCGAYAVSSSWNGQFGAGNGFTTWCVVDGSRKLAVWPAYTDRELVNGVAVVPDRSYPPQAVG